MSLPPYQYRPVTPPALADLPALVSGGHCRTASASSDWSARSSPDSLDRHVVTPLHGSPAVHQHGPALLPRIRTQDQSLAPSFFPAAPHAKGHRRASSLAPSYSPARVPARPAYARATTSPPEGYAQDAPASATSAASAYSSFFGSGSDSVLNSPVSFAAPSAHGHRRPCGHSRSVSASSVDSLALGRFGYPAYRRQPPYRSGPYWSPSVVPGSSTFVPSLPAPEEPRCFDLPEDLLCEQPDEATMTPNQYLRAPNPAIRLCRQASSIVGRGQRKQFWWDVRNLRTWEDFSLETVMAVPSFPQLLDIPVNASAFSTPYIARARLCPDGEPALVDLIRDFFAVKVNAATRVTQGIHRHMAMRVSHERDGPSFTSNYEDDRSKTILGNGQGRIVGIVRSFERWNSGHRAEKGQRRVDYLDGLSHLHRCMREHQCRYGFIMTEMELVCVRAGTDEIPLFGLLELAPPIATSETEGLTVCLALWYLHMLAKEEPLPGQYGWRLNVGAPGAMTRQHFLPEKDAWMPEPQVGEKRDAKNTRGWVMPGDPWNKKREGGKAWSKRLHA